MSVLTGIAARVETLPLANISTINFHNQNSETKYYSHNPAIPAIDQISTTNKACVYMYEDKYSFKRILPSDSLIFDSHFESGNLYSAFRFNPAEVQAGTDQLRDIYELQMTTDVNTHKYCQWFYFRVSNTRPGRVLFRITNFMKPWSMYCKGMRPLIYANVADESTGDTFKCWSRTGGDITYTPNEHTKGTSESPPTYTLAFTHCFERTNDNVYFAFALPYTYTDVQQYLNGLSSDKRVARIVRRRRLCNTTAGNRCDLLTITADATTPEELQTRSGIVIMSRVHPGETNASWIMQGIIDFLVGNTTEAMQLRERYVFKIIPMLNPGKPLFPQYFVALMVCIRWSYQWK